MNPARPEHHGFMKTALTIGSASLVAVPLLGLAVLAGSGNAAGPSSSGAACLTSGPIAGLDASQARNARAIVASAQQVSIAAHLPAAMQTQSELIALMTAATESRLRDYANPHVPASLSLPNDGLPPTGGDLDSVGLFQQRATWGPLTVRMDQAQSTALFVRHLLAIPAWSTLPPAIAAQTVQQSRFPDRYAEAQTGAAGWLAQITRSHAWQTCGADGLPPASQQIRPGTLPAGYAIPAVATDAERRAITFALAQLGKPYVFGASGPDSYDCSGLTMAAWAVAGVELPHYTVAQYRTGTPVPGTALLSPADLIFIPGSDGSLDPPNPQHVGLYLGAGYVIEAPQVDEVVKVVPLAAFGPIIGIRHEG